MKQGFIAYGQLKPGLSGNTELIHDMMEEVKNVASKFELEVKMYGIPYGVSEDFVVEYESDKGLVNYYNFGLEAELPYNTIRTVQVAIIT